MPREELSAREAFEQEKPFSTKIVLEHRKKRGPGLPDEFSTTTQEYPYLTSEQKHLVERAVAEALLALGLKSTTTTSNK